MYLNDVYSLYRHIAWGTARGIIQQMSQLWTNDGGSALDRWWNQYRQRRARSKRSHVEVFVRACVPASGTHAHRTRFFDRLAAANSDQIDGYETTVVGDEICVCEKCRQFDHQRQLLETVRSLMSWEWEGLQASGFVEREIHSTVTNERHTVVSVPELAVGVYLDESLVGVFPCRDGETNLSPDVFLQRLTSEGFKRSSGEDRSAVHSESG